MPQRPYSRCRVGDQACGEGLYFAFAAWRKAGERRLLSVIYISVADPLIGEQDIAALLVQARRNNQRDALTGALIFNGHNFLQLLEGPADKVDGCLAVIRSDPRHSGMVEIRRREIAERAFAEWTMLYDPQFRGHDDALSRLAGSGRLDPQDALMMENFIALGRRTRPSGALGD
ncbi:MAG: BLUF domain-containing protein [Sphingopyxis sp.]|nr:BLUF domain-containing protein [Sphingopyxis sp.]